MSFYHRPSAPTHWTCLTVTGPDAQDYLHRMTTANVRELSPGTGSTGCFLTPQGKIRSFFTLWMLAPDAFVFEIEAGADQKWKQELLTVIDQFHFAEQFVVHEQPKGLECLWAFPDKAGTSQDDSLKVVSETSGCRIFRHGVRDFGRTWLTVWGTASELAAWQEVNLAGAAEAPLETLESWRIEALRPKVGSEIDENSIPLELGLRDAVAENKGCYPGQEVIEKIAALGSPARRLSLIEGTGPAPAVGDPILSESQPPAEIGRISSVSAALGDFRALAILRKTNAKEGLAVKFSSGSSAKITRVAPYTQEG